MARMIDADALLEKLQRMIAYCEKDKQVNGLTALFQVGDAIMDCPTITQPNEPLTLEDLSLCNDPVWIKRMDDEDLSDDGWAIVEGPRCLTWRSGIPVSWEILVWWPGSEVEDCPKYEKYGKTWLAYRRPPEEEEET